MKHRAKPKGIKKKGCKKTYQGEVVQVFVEIWEICGRICSERLKPFLPEIVRVLEHHNEIHMTAEIITMLFSMSTATMDRRLRSVRYEKGYGLSTTKPGTLLKKGIPIHIYAAWEDERPGSIEIDLVAHCGQTTEGQYLNTLTATYIATGWTECIAISNMTHVAFSQAIQELRQRLPFPLLGLDSDNGSEFINETLFRYCQTEQITFTRSRPFQKMIKPMLNKRTGLLFVKQSAMIAFTQSKNWLC